MALLLSVLLLLFVLTQVLGLDGIFNNSSGVNMSRPAVILLKAVSDFGAVAAGLYYVILYHSRAEMYY